MVEAAACPHRRVPERGGNPGLAMRSRQQASDYRCGVAMSARSDGRSEEHTSELQSLMRNSYAVFCLKKKKKTKYQNVPNNIQKTVHNKKTYKYKHHTHINIIHPTNTTTHHIKSTHYHTT